MKSSSLRGRSLLTLLGLVAGMAASPALATHFRYGHITWKHVGAPANRDIEFTVTNAWRQDAVTNGAYQCVNLASFVNQSTALAYKNCTGPFIGGKFNPGVGDYFVELVGGTKFDFGDGSALVGSPGNQPLVYKVTSADPPNNWVFAVAIDPASLPASLPDGDTTIQHHYGSNTVRTVHISDCCRISPCTAPNAHMNNPDGNYDVTAVVDPSATDSSPVSALPPIVYCPINALCTFPIPVSDNEGDTLNFRLSTPAEAAFTSQPGPPQCGAGHAASIDPTTGVYSWETTTCRLASNPTPVPPNGGCNNGALNTLYSTQVMIQETGKNTKTALDFLIQLVPRCTLPNAAPVFDQATPPCGSTISAGPGTPVTFSVHAHDADVGDSITLNVVGVPGGASVVPSLPTTASPVGASVSWTPTVADVGQYVLNFSAIDGCNSQTFCAVTIDVSQENCTDGIDNDGDGLADCADADCNGTPCDDGDACTSNDHCNFAAATCVGGGPTNCDDGNPCTNDDCNTVTGCFHNNNTASCDDGLFCTGADTCSGGSCVHTGNPCAGGPQCAQTCNEAADNCFDAPGTACNDGLFCNGADTCNGSGSCSGHAGDPCAGGPACAHTCNEGADNCFDPSGTACADDGNVCTSDSCNGAGACAHPPVSLGTVCRPQAGQCDVAEQCDGTGSPCPPDGFASNGTPCNDGNACTTGEQCTANVCGGGSTISCDDSNPCTTDGCNMSTGCTHDPNSNACDDGLFCNGTDTCAAKTCSIHSGNPCSGGPQCANTCNETADNCFATAGTGCDDGLFCTENDVCNGGSCQGTARNCSDSNPCTQDACSESPQQCTHDPAPFEGQPCNDGNSCTTGEVCTSGMCVNGSADPLGCVDHFKCYKTRAPFPKRTVSLVDQFGSSTATVVRPSRLCNPVNKNSEGIVDETEHLMCYTILEPRGAARDVRVTNQFGTQDLHVIKAVELCNPAEKNLVPSSFNGDHFKCYQVRGKGFAQRNVSLVDQFETKNTTVVIPKLLCNPVNKNGEGVPNPQGHLVCYKIKDVPGQTSFVPRTVTVSDQFAQSDFKALRGDCRQSSYLCVPSLKQELP
jgi:hypothetical protein